MRHSFFHRLAAVLRGLSAADGGGARNVPEPRHYGRDGHRHSALEQYEIDGAVGMYSDIFCNPFMIWDRYKRGFFKISFTVSFQFHHTQTDGMHAARFLNNKKKEINGLQL